MIKISEDFFSNTPLFSSISNYIIPEEVKNPRYGYSPRLEELRYENIYTGQELKSIITVHNITLKLRQNPLFISNVTIDSSILGFGPLSVDGLPYSITLQFAPLFILEHFLKNKAMLELQPLVYKKALIEYNIRHSLFEEYLRPLDNFCVNLFPSVTVTELYYNPISLNSYDKYFDQVNDEELETYIYLDFYVFDTTHRKLSLRDLQIILLNLNMKYINATDSNIKLYPRSSANNILTDNFIGIENYNWIISVFDELEKREKEYINLIQKPENILFKI